MANNLKENPFTALFGSLSEAEIFSKQNDDNLKATSENKNPDNEAEILLLEKLLLITTRNPPGNLMCVYMNDSISLDMDTYEMVLFDRLQLKKDLMQVINLSDDQKLTPNTEKWNSKGELVNREEVIRYLYDIYDRCYSERNTSTELIKSVQSSVITNMFTALEEPEIFSHQNIHKQFQDMVLHNISISSCLSEIVFKLLDQKRDNEIPFKSLFEEILKEVQRKLDLCSLTGVIWSAVDILDLYASSAVLAPLIIPFPKNIQNGRAFQSTPLGSLLSISCLPRSLGKSYDFFEEPSRQGAAQHSSTEASIGSTQKALNQRVHTIFMTLLKTSESTKHLLLSWLEACLQSNGGRSGLWHVQEPSELSSLRFVCDGFMANLASVMLKLSAPFTKDVHQDGTNFKILKVHPLYCSPAVAKNKEKISGLYSGDLSKQTMLVPSEVQEEEIDAIGVPSEFSFTTTCFFLTHRAIQLGVLPVIQKLHRLYQQLNHMQSAISDATAQGSDAASLMRTRMEQSMQVVLSLKAAICAPDINQLVEFLAATSLWLMQLAACDGAIAIPIPYSHLTEAQLDPDAVAPKDSVFRVIPESVAENVIEVVVSLRRIAADALAMAGPVPSGMMLDLSAAFMGAPHRINNPHLRARLAEVLEALMPRQNEEGINIGVMGGSLQAERLFSERRMARHLATAIIHVFVSIEMTGQSVAFEEKFNYRRPMYDVMKYMWSVRMHRQQFVRLCDFALAHMESAKPPLFLRFVNLLINDAIFLLDEGLSYMAQIKKAQDEKDSGEWERLAANQRAEREQELSQMGFLAGFHNMLGTRTIQTLGRLTEEMPKMFSHPTLVDRIAAMLNYFLAHLVGPKQRDLKVRDMEKFDFRPSEMVRDICLLYANLGSAEAFAKAVSADDRSYSPQLFQQADKILMRFGHINISEKIRALGSSVALATQLLSRLEDLIGAAPERFVDPIMLTLMTNPVRLPSSNMVVDRQTIARHLLSDQTDPFNRQPLTMEQIISDEELKAEISAWLEKEGQKSTPR